MPTRNALLRSIVLSATLTCIGGAAAFAGAPNPNTFLNGTYSVVFFKASPESDAATFIFDGAGSYTGTDVSNTGGVITTSPISGTYTVASDGTFTAVDGMSGNVINGDLSADGNVIVITKVTTGETPCIIVGVKQGAISNLNDASGILALVSNTTGS